MQTHRWSVTEDTGQGASTVQSSGPKCVRGSCHAAPQEAAQVATVVVSGARTGAGDREEMETYISLTVCAVEIIM